MRLYFYILLLPFNVGLARVAELADALGSGPSEGNFIGVQVPFRALFYAFKSIYYMDFNI